LPTNDEYKVGNSQLWCESLVIPYAVAQPAGGTIRKLGILAGLFGDGAVRIYAVPDPENFKPESGPAYGMLRHETPCIWY
jgi:hypothetical protein